MKTDENRFPCPHFGGRGTPFLFRWVSRSLPPGGRGGCLMHSGCFHARADTMEKLDNWRDRFAKFYHQASFAFRADPVLRDVYHLRAAALPAGLLCGDHGHESCPRPRVQSPMRSGWPSSTPSTPWTWISSLATLVQLKNMLTGNFRRQLALHGAGAREVQRGHLDLRDHGRHRPDPGAAHRDPPGHRGCHQAVLPGGLRHHGRRSGGYLSAYLLLRHHPEADLCRAAEVVRRVRPHGPQLRPAGRSWGRCWTWPTTWCCPS